MTRSNVVKGRQTSPKEQLWSRPYTAISIIVGGLVLLILGCAFSIAKGSKDIPLEEVWQALVAFNPLNSDHQIIWELRLPRTIAGALVGAAFAVSGALMQGMTRNPIADPGLLGVNAGAGFVLALCFAFFPGLSFNQLILFSFVGAAVGVGLVYGIGSLAKGGLSPVRLALAGSAVAALLVALSEGIALYFRISQDLAFWYAGGVAGVTWAQIDILWPWIVLALIGSLLLSRSITILSLGDDVASGLGQRTALVRLGAVLAVMVLAGASVSTVGAVGFLGLMIPHAARAMVGVDYKWVIPTSAILGALLMVVADTVGRLSNPPHETPVSALIALIGVPYFFYIIRKKVRDNL
ncbi:FecCD family ABC transporter permease [Paenibacillus nuruki]|uniref:FecCD family ABC transporter permease n=1 Tax=Paenibacillus nuruki TaxID=1886670 RepID=UPI002805EF2C|nr:iron ABC transporter permease [Paenibacillus nuruki]CAJ1317769.1 Iron(3+)-hydroxamate import system permease protein FhuB [Paenibacillus nuruki]